MPEEIRATGAHMMRIHNMVSKGGDLVGGEALAVAVAVAAKIVSSDGAFLVSDDDGGTIFRIAYTDGV